MPGKHRNRIGVVYVIDVFHNSVVAFDLRLQFLFAFGEQGKKEGQFAFPKGLALQRMNSL